MIKLVQDSFEIFLKSINNETVNLIITDPPYWTLNKWREIGTTTRLGGHKNADERDEDKWFDTIDADILTLRYVLSYADDMDWRKVKPLVWDKVNQGMGYTYRCRHEFIVFLEKGKRRLNDLSIPDILAVKKIVNGYPTEKPVELMEILIRQSSLPGEIVCDPFFGSGSVAIAARNLRRAFTGCDISPKAHEYFNKREENQTALF